MDIVQKLMDSIPLLDGDNKKIIQDLLVAKLQEQSNVVDKPVEQPKEVRDFQELMNYNGEETSERKQER